MHPSRNLFRGDDKGGPEGLSAFRSVKAVTDPTFIPYRANICSPPWCYILRFLPYYHIDRRSTVSNLHACRNPGTNPQACASPYTAAIDNTPENERILVIGNASQSPNPPWNSSEDLSRTKPNTETKTRKFPKLKFSLTAPPLKPKAKQPGKVPPPVVSCSLF